MIPSFHPKLKSTSVRVLTLHQPWATLIVQKHKKYETRSWGTKFRGSLFIHAGKLLNKEYSALPEVSKLIGNSNIPLGSIVAVCELSKIFRSEDVRDSLEKNELLCGDFGDGRYAWQLDNMQILSEPVSCAGHQGLWIPSESLVKQVMEQV